MDYHSHWKKESDVRDFEVHGHLRALCQFGYNSPHYVNGFKDAFESAKNLFEEWLQALDKADEDEQCPDLVKMFKNADTFFHALMQYELFCYLFLVGTPSFGDRLGDIYSKDLIEAMTGKYPGVGDEFEKLKRKRELDPKLRGKPLTEAQSNKDRGRVIKSFEKWTALTLSLGADLHIDSHELEKMIQVFKNGFSSVEHRKLLADKGRVDLVLGDRISKEDIGKKGIKTVGVTYLICGVCELMQICLGIDESKAFNLTKYLREQFDPEHKGRQETKEKDLINYQTYERKYCPVSGVTKKRYGLVGSLIPLFDPNKTLRNLREHVLGFSEENCYSHSCDEDLLKTLSLSVNGDKTKFMELWDGKKALREFQDIAYLELRKQPACGEVISTLQEEMAFEKERRENPSNLRESPFPEKD